LLLDRFEQFKKIQTWSNRLAGQKILLRTFCSRLSSFLNRNGHRVKLKIVRDKELEKNDWTIGAEYDPALDEIGQKPFRLNFIINHDRIVPWEITKEDCQELSLCLLETLVHEYQHLKQYRARGYVNLKHKYKGPRPVIDDSSEIDYLSNPDELDAYSENIATRLYIERDMLNITRDKEHWDLHTYYKAFGKEHPVTQELKDLIENKLTSIREKQHVKSNRDNDRR
jgi:hypothetical protein